MKFWKNHFFIGLKNPLINKGQKVSYPPEVVFIEISNYYILKRSEMLRNAYLR